MQREQKSKGWMEKDPTDSQHLEVLPVQTPSQSTVCPPPWVSQVNGTKMWPCWDSKQRTTWDVLPESQNQLDEC